MVTCNGLSIPLIFKCIGCSFMPIRQATRIIILGYFSLFNFCLFILYTCWYIQSGPDERSIPGNTIAVHADLPFTGLTTFGGSFLSKFECSQMPHQVSYFFNWCSGISFNEIKECLLYLIQLHIVTAAWTFNICGHTWSVIWRKATDTEKLWFHWCHIMVCSKMWFNTPPFWPPQAWY